MLAPSPSGSRGEPILQPAYFTSSAFVHAARADVDGLVQAFARQHTRPAPFARFKEIWQSQGWTWIQFKAFDTRSRATFLGVMMRLFLERVGAGEPPLARTAALFGLYTLYFTQPCTSAPPLQSVTRAQVTCDVYREMLVLPDALDGEHLLPIRPHVIYVQSRLLQARAFDILPRGDTHPLGPRTLPREVVEDAGWGHKKRGRPCRRERTERARDSLAALAGWGEGWSGPGETRGRYAAARAVLLGGIRGEARWEDALARAGGAVVGRMATLKQR